MSNYVIPGFDEDGGRLINSPLDYPETVAVIGDRWCETHWTDSHDECAACNCSGYVPARSDLYDGTEPCGECNAGESYVTLAPANSHYQPPLQSRLRAELHSARASEFRLTGRDSLCPSGAAFVSTMPPSPSGDSKGLVAKNNSSSKGVY